MPYSVDGEENKKNPHSPSEYLTMNEQLMYKLAALDAAVQGGFRRLDEKMDRFQHDLHEGQIATNDRINKLDKEVVEQIAIKRKRIDEVCDRLNKIETWQQVAMAKVGVTIAVISGALALLGPSIRNVLGIAG